VNAGSADHTLTAGLRKSTCRAYNNVRKALLRFLNTTALRRGWTFAGQQLNCRHIVVLELAQPPPDVREESVLLKRIFWVHRVEWRPRYTVYKEISNPHVNKFEVVVKAQSCKSG
jgi:hypothetical protein